MSTYTPILFWSVMLITSLVGLFSSFPKKEETHTLLVSWTSTAQTGWVDGDCTIYIKGPVNEKAIQGARKWIKEHNETATGNIIIKAIHELSP